MHTLRFLSIIFIFLLNPIMIFGSNNITLPTYHDSYKYIEELQFRGYCLDIQPMNLPYLKNDVIKSLTNLKNDTSRPSLFVNQIADKLLLELNKQHNDSFNLFIHFYSDLDKQYEGNYKYRGVYRFGGSVQLSDNVSIFNSIILDQYAYNSTTYRGYKWRGFAGYTEQAYLFLNWDKISLKIGRDFLKWSVGRTGTLAFSNHSQPLDQILAEAKLSIFRFTFLAAELDEFPSLKMNNINVPVRRYISAHRLSLNLFNNRLQAAVSEILLYGGPNETFKFAYLNPVISYRGAHKNGLSKNANTLPTFDILFYPKPNIQFYSSILVDDMQVEKTGPVDLEPNEIGLIIGTKWADPFNFQRLTCGFEYVRISNRTYQTVNDFEAFIHRNEPLGHPFGNDFYLYNVNFSYWMNNKFWLGFDYLNANHGEGNIYNTWDAPWMQVSLKDGYSEKFPTGVVEKSTIIKMSLFWDWLNWLNIYGTLSYNDIKNHQNQSGLKANYWEWRLRFEWEWNSDFTKLR